MIVNAVLNTCQDKVFSRALNRTHMEKTCAPLEEIEERDVF